MGKPGSGVALLLALCACGVAGEERASSAVFRVGASSGFSRLVPGDTDGSAAAAADLVFEFAPQLVASIQANANRIEIVRKPTARFTAQQLADSVRYRGLVSARAIDRDRIEVVMDGASNALRMAERGDLGFDLGPFEIESERLGVTRLRRRTGSGIAVIEIAEVSSADEWRKFLARELDVMSASPSLYRDQFDGMDSVRVVDVPPLVSAALFFNVRDPALASAGVRRRISAALNRAAIARVVSGDPSAGAPAVVARDDKTARLPERLSVMVPEDESLLVLTASVLRHQLARTGVVLAVDAIPFSEVLRRTDTGDYQLVLGQLPMGSRTYVRFVSPRPDAPSITGFADPAFDAAVEDGDLETARAIFDRELPATVLYEWRTFAAIDSHFCGDVTPSYTSWRWMADLYPCDARGPDEDTP